MAVFCYNKDMKKVFIILILILLTWLGYQAFIFLVPPKYCVKISGGWDYPLEDWAIKKNIKVALDLIKEHSSQDYERLCVYGPRIQLTGAPVLDSARPVSFGAAGHYIDRHYSTPEGQGLITINRAYAHDLLLLSEVIVHETCHAYLIQTQQDYREEPCYQRGWEHVARIPETIKNLLQPSDEPTPVVAFSVYCGDDKKIGANSIAGYCVFANNSDQ